MYGPVPGTGSWLSGGGDPGGTRSANVIASFWGSAGSGLTRRMVIVPVASSVWIPASIEHVFGLAWQAA